jgi:hypothetical protein
MSQNEQEVQKDENQDTHSWGSVSGKTYIQSATDN